VKPHWLLFPLVPLYGVVSILRNWFFDIGIVRSVDVGVPVISIGNITTGGTGKTPIVKNVAMIFLESGKRVAIISRGYGRNTKGTVVVCNGKDVLADANSAGDEPLLLAENVRDAIVIVDEDRVRGSKRAINDFGADVIVLDDGFQHRHIKRTKDIVLIDAHHSPFDTMLLPAGYRRESKSSFSRVDAVVVTKANTAAEAAIEMERSELVPIGHKFSSSFRPIAVHHLFGGVKQSLEILKGHSAVALCGIAKPESFQQSLHLCRVNVKKYFNFPDHYRFTTMDVENVLRAFQNSKADYIMTTEKDAVRLREFEKDLKQVPIFVLKMDVAIHQSDEWKKYLMSGLQ
jgi:tetraacyldisaccharide 4'-kinase